MFVFPPTQYRIMMDSMFYLSGCCRYCLSRIKRVKSLTDMLIDKDALLQYPDYDEVSSADILLITNNSMIFHIE